jgi:D-glycero-alpha-D-manno-heptose 1-phosphate guanylyltransferase
VLDQLVAAGFRTAVLAVGYRHQAIRAQFGEDYRGLALSYSVESEPLGTGGAIRMACEQTSAEHVFVLNGDTYLELDFQAMLSSHRRFAAELSMAICHVPDVARYGALRLRDEIVQGFLEKGQSGPGWINAGTYILAPALRARFPPTRAFSFEHDVLAPEVVSIVPRVFRCSGRFIDIGIPDDYVRAQTLFQPAQ